VAKLPSALNPSSFGNEENEKTHVMGEVKASHFCWFIGGSFLLTDSRLSAIVTA
jgi:hypothetical protein